MLLNITTSVAMLMTFFQGQARAADLAPQTAKAGTVLLYSGFADDSIEGEFDEEGDLHITSSTNFDGGSYTYTKTGPNSASVTFRIVTADEEYYEDENGTLQITFDSTGGGSYQSSSTYSGTLEDEMFEGSYTGSGTFTYTYPLQFKTSAKLASGKVGKNYRNQLKSTGGTTKNTWSLAKGKLPAGLKLSKTGLISGKPTKAATYKFSLKVKNALAQSAEMAVTLVVKKK